MVEIRTYEDNKGIELFFTNGVDVEKAFKVFAFKNQTIFNRRKPVELIESFIKSYEGEFNIVKTKSNQHSLVLFFSDKMDFSGFQDLNDSIIVINLIIDNSDLITHFTFGEP